MYTTNYIRHQIKSKTSILQSSLCDYSDAYILVSGTITVPNIAADGPNPKNIKNKIIKNVAPFTT